VAELLRMPEIETGTSEAVLSSWSVAENSTVAVSDVIAVVETAKAVVDVEAESSGTILRLLVLPGAEVETGAPIALLAGPGEQVGDIDAVLRELGLAADPVALEVPEAATTPQPSPVQDEVSRPVAASVSSQADVPAPREGRVFASPLARRLAKEAGLSVDVITGTGPNGRIVRRDVERAALTASAQAPGAEPAAPTADAGAYTEVPHSRLRRLVASRLTESKTTAPHFYLRSSVRADALLALRTELNDGAEVRVSVNDLLVKAVARAHVLVPALNVTWTQDAVRHWRSVDVAVAVATDNGLVTPVVRSVEELSVTAVARTVQDLAERARAGRLKQHELEGGSISVTNLGMYGTEEFAAIINPPQASILAVGAARQEPVVVGARLEVATVLRLTLSVDHRPVDGVVAAQWMAAIVTLLEHPARILA
jgi:pyruvate dehydrogenase E2 component (dihydrolipoamide acetyltransferase)